MAQRADKLLAQLLKFFYRNDDGSLCWRYYSHVSVGDRDEQLETDLLAWLEDNTEIPMST